MFLQHDFIFILGTGPHSMYRKSRHIADAKILISELLELGLTMPINQLRQEEFDVHKIVHF